MRVENFPDGLTVHRRVKIVEHAHLGFITTGDKSPSSALFEMVGSYWVSQTIYVAANLGIAGLLMGEPKNSGELANSTGAYPSSLYRLMRSLVSIGVFAEDGRGRFRLTPIADSLRMEAPDSMRTMAIMHGERHYQTWSHLLRAVKTGETVFKHTFNMEFFEHLAQGSEESRTFDSAITNRSSMTNAAVVATYDFFDVGKVIDVRGDRGSLLASILKANPRTRGILIHRPHVIEGAKRFIEKEEVSDHCEFIAGDLFDWVPSSSNLYFLSCILHDWDGDRAVKILKHCRRAMTHHGKILVAAMVIPHGNQPYYGKFHDLPMMVITGGCNHTEAKCRDLLNSAGFELTTIFSTQSSVRVIEGIPA